MHLELVKPSAVACTLLALSGCATVPSPAPSHRPAIPKEILARKTCREDMVSEPRMTVADFPSDVPEGGVQADVIVSYRLDGSGRAVDTKVVYSYPETLFDKTTLSLLHRTRFAPGVVQPSCTYVRTYRLAPAGSQEIPVDAGVKPVITAEGASRNGT